MSTMKEINERANEIFNERFEVADILKGNCVDMHKECWDEAKLEFDEIEKYVEGLNVQSL